MLKSQLFFFFFGGGVKKCQGEPFVAEGVFIFSVKKKGRS